MPFFWVPVLILATALFAVEQEQPTPYDLIRPIWPMKWDTAATDDGGTVESFSKYKPNPKKHNTVPPVGTMPQDFVPNGIIPDTLNQAFRDAQNLRIGRIRVNQAGYLPDDPSKQFYYVSAGTCAETYVVVDLEGNAISKPASLKSTGKATTSSWVINAGTDAATANQGRYETSGQGPDGIICEGHLTDVPELTTDTRYRIKILNQYSATFIISDKVYSMVRDATLKFYGINRSGNSESWFHKPSHTKDGAGSFVSGKNAAAGFTSKEGALQGGWYDCGDHLKESQTQAYAFMVLAVMASSNPDRDEDHYAYNMGETMNTDGIPDILREAKHGADFFMRAYRFADGIIDNMAVSVGNFGADHGWWGRPENQDALPATLTGRGGPHERDIRLGELGSNISGQIAAGLALLSVDYATYDKAFADSCLMVAEQLYDFAKNLALGKSTYGMAKYGKTGLKYVYNTVPAGWSSAAYNGNNEYHDDLALAAWALHYATYPKTGDDSYLKDAISNKEMVESSGIGTDKFPGGWMGSSSNGMTKSSKNTSWANAYTYTLYGFYKVLLRDTETAAKYGISEADRLLYSERVLYTMAANVSYLSGSGSNSIDLPNPNSETPLKLSYGDLWYSMQTDQTWIYNRYQAGNIFEVLAYSDIAKDFEGVKLPQKGVQNWNAEKMKQLGINQLNYMLGVNPWDVSFLLGVGDKNDAHPHHRAANPEGKNMPGAGYKYNPPIGALFGGITPDDINAWDPGGLSWENYHIAETCIDATAMFVASSAVAVREEDRRRAPSQINVEVRYAGYDSAIVKISQDVRGPVMILYSENETGPFNNPVKGAENGVSHELHMTGLKNGTTYYFKVVAINGMSEAYTTKWLVDSTTTPFSFTTLVSPLANADIQNVKVCNLTSDTAEIMWYTPNGEYESKVYWDTVPHANPSEYAFNTGDVNADVSGIPTMFHYVKVGGLQEKKTYYFLVESNGVVQSVDSKGSQLTFTTPVTHYDFDVSVYQYEFGGMDFMNLNLINNEDRAFSDLTLRFYVTAKPEDIEAQPGQNNQPGTCPLLVDEDICQAYDEAGFNKPCVNKNGESVDDSLRYYLRHAVPVKLEDTYNPATGEYDWYIPVPLGGTTIKSSSRMRIDLGFSSGIYQNGQCETLRTPAKKRLKVGLGDWSWDPHKRDVDGADYAGIPEWDKDQGDIEQAPVNPYIVVYRKDEFISGFSPSYKEMTTKRAHYDMVVAYDPPFNVSNGSYVKIDSATSTMHLTGTALISESGYVTGIWVNGVALTKEQVAKAAVYNYETGKFDLDIPAKMKIGTNKVDVTLFAGPNPECDECQANGGCAFVNRSYYVQFSKGDRTQGQLLLVKEDGNSVTSPAPIDGSLKFQIQLRDKDSRANSSMTVKLFNSRTGDSVDVTLSRVNESLGYFEGTWLTASTSDKGLPNVNFLGGDTIWVKYQDPADEEERDSVWFFSEPTRPVPQKAVFESEVCTVTGDAIAETALKIEFSGSQFDGSKIILDSVLVEIDSTASSPKNSFMLMPSGVVTGREASFTVDATQLGTANPRGNLTIYMREDGTVQTSTVAISDAIKPKLTNVSILENENHASERDTLKIAFSEPVNLPSTTTWPLAVYDGTSEIDQTGIRVISATSNDDGKSWLYVIEGNTDGNLIKPTFRAQIVTSFAVTDMSGNSLATCAPVTVIESTRPVPIQYAKISDFTGDGQPDEVYIEFVRKLRDKDNPDTVDVYWGNPAIYVPFERPAEGWKLEAVYGEKTVVPRTVMDSTKGSWVKGTEKKVCDQWKDVVSYVFDTTYTYVYDALDTTLVTDSTIAKIDTVSSTTTQQCASYLTSQDSTFIPKVDTVGFDTVQAEHDVIRLAIPAGTYKNVTYGANGGNGAVLARKGPIEGLLDASTYKLSDDCPPVIVSAVWQGFELSSGQRDFLKVTMSEPLDSIENHPYLVERRREGVAGVYYNHPSVVPDHRVNHADLSSPVFEYHYDHEVNGAIWFGDSIRLVPDADMSFYKDGAGLFAGKETPWVPVVGVIKKIKVKIDLVDNVTISGDVATSYAGQRPLPNEQFRLSLNNKEEATQVIAAGGATLKPVSMKPLPNYKHAGPVFKIEITLPEANDVDATGVYKRDFDVAFEMGIFSNMGSFVNGTKYKFQTSSIQEYVTANNTVTLYLEWCAPEDYPVSSDNKKIGTGPYIAKVETKITGRYKAAVPDEGDDKKDLKDSDTFTKTFGFRRAKR